VGHPKPQRHQGTEPQVAWHRMSFVKPMKSEGGYCSEVTASRRTPGEAGLRLGTPAEAAIALAMAMITALGDVVVNGWCRQGLEVYGLRRTQGFQHRIKPLPRPLQ
jgi:hypothetical protein